VPFMDATGLQTLQDVIRDFERHGTRVLLSEATPRVHGKLTNAGLIRGGMPAGNTNYFADLHEALAAADLPQAAADGALAR